MGCARCGGKPYYEDNSTSLCRGCFSEVIEKRVRKETRLSRLVSPHDSILMIDDGTAVAACLIKILTDIVGKMPAKLETLKRRYKAGERIAGPYSKIALPLCQDDEVSAFLDAMFQGKKPKGLGHCFIGKKQYIKPMIHVSIAESSAYAKMHRLKCSVKKKPHELISALSARHPEVAFNLGRNIRELKKIIN
jgi:hypothetical protein